MTIKKRIASIIMPAVLLPIVFASFGCGDKKADESTVTATSPGKPNQNTTAQQPAQPGEAANGGAGMQSGKVFTPPK